MIPILDIGPSGLPLPADYQELTDEGQRQARVVGCRQWQITYDQLARVMFGGQDFVDLSDSAQHIVRERKATLAVASFHLFNRLYLLPIDDEDGNKLYDSLFYGTTPLPTPAFHDESLRLHTLNKYVAEVHPRGSAKSTHLRAIYLQKLVTRAGHDIVYTTASHPLAEITGDKLRYQLDENSLINDDWNPEYGGSIRPERGLSPWGITYFVTRQRSSFKISSVESIQRGLRPDDYGLDDPEHDPSSSTDMQVTRDEMEHLIRRVIMPMIQKPGSKLWWRGTFVSQRHYLWAAMENATVIENGIPQSRAAISMFNNWQRRVVDVYQPNPDGTLRSIWPEMWPKDDAEKKALKCSTDTQTLAQVEEDITSPAFMAEFRGQPGAGGAAYFGEVTEAAHGYWYEDMDPFIDTSPTISQTSICWQRDGKVIKITLAEFLKRFSTFICVDPAYTESSTADFKVVTCMAVTDANELFILDTWRSNRKPVSEMNLQAFQMAERWHSVAICPEKVKGGHAAIAGLMELVRTKAADVVGVTHLAQIRPINPGVIAKTDKIAALFWRFQHAKIKLPVKHRGSNKWLALFNQIESFDPNMRDGGLKHDDDLDVVAASQYLTTLPRAVASPKGAENDVLARWRKGERVDRNGIPLLYKLPTKLLTDEDLKCLFQPPDPKSKKHPLI